MSERGKARISASPLILAIATAMACAQQQPGANPSGGDVFASQGQPTTYSDQFSPSCEARNANNPFAGMNPLVCQGEMMPTGGAPPGSCNFPGMILLKQQGNTCYYCKPIVPPIKGIIVPIDIAALAEGQGFACSEDEADPDCMLICSGTGTFKPPPGVTVSGPPGNPASQPPSSPPNGPSAAPVQPIATQPVSKPCTPTKNSYIECLSGLVSGVGECLQSAVTTIAGAGHFVAGDFTGAAQIWGIQPGQSAFLGTLYKELNTPIVGQNVSAFQQCQAIGKRICAVVLKKGAGAAAKAAGSVIRKGVSAGGSTEGGAPGTGIVPANGSPGGGNPSQPSLPDVSKTQPTAGGAPASLAITGGTSPANAIGGLDLLVDVSKNPAELVGRYVSLPGGPQQLGSLASANIPGSFATVYQMTPAYVVKFSTTAPGSADALAGQVAGARILNGIGVPTPGLGNYQPATIQSPGSLVASDFRNQWPDSVQLTSKDFANMSPADQNAVLGSFQQYANRLGSTGNIMVDANPANFAILSNNGSFILIVIDPDTIMPASRLQSALANNVVLNGIYEFQLKAYGADCPPLQQPIDAQSFMNNTWLRMITYRLRNGGGAK